MSDLRKNIQMKGISGMLPPLPPKECHLDQDVFRVYRRGTEGPVVLFLHGGGLSALSWAVLSSVVTSRVKCQCLALDFRGHGNTVTTNEEDLSAQTLASDVGNVITALFGDEQVPPIIVVGHSMGGAIAIHAAIQYLIPSLAGLVVIDVVEGTALEALQSMQNFLRGRPKQFKSLEYAIEWAVKSGQIRNVESARVSMVGQLKRCSEISQPPSHQIPSCSSSEAIAEEDEEQDETKEDVTHQQVDVTRQQVDSNSISQSNSIAPSVPYSWRVDLTKSERHWQGWFEGMSNLFLSCSVPKMLLLAGVDRLDRELTVGQMQGKFWMQVLPQCGHCVHEDQPQKVADVLAAFMIRNKFSVALEDFEQTSPSC